MGSLYARRSEHTVALVLSRLDLYYVKYIRPKDSWFPGFFVTYSAADGYQGFGGLCLTNSNNPGNHEFYFTSVNTSNVSYST